MSRTHNRRPLTASALRRIEPSPLRKVYWDVHPGLCVIVQPSGVRTWYFVYSLFGRPRWYRIGRVENFSVEEARKRVRSLAGKTADGVDVQGERRSLHGADSFEKLHARYVREHAKHHNKSWEEGERLIKRYALPSLGQLKASTITRGNVRELIGSLSAKPSLSNLVLAHISAVFSWATNEEIIAANPARGIPRRAVHSRSRVLSDSEIPVFWRAFDQAGLLRSTALKIILLTGARPGEVAAMQHAHIKDSGSWWEMPGAPCEGWPGTKNSRDHRIFLVDEVRELIAELHDPVPGTGYVFGSVLSGLDSSMRLICKTLKAPRLRPHDLRRSFASTVCALGYGRPAMDRLLGHADRSISAVYDRHSYEREDMAIMISVARKIMAAVAGESDTTVTAFRRV